MFCSFDELIMSLLCVTLIFDLVRFNFISDSLLSYEKKKSWKSNFFFYNRLLTEGNRFHGSCVDDLNDRRDNTGWFEQELLSNIC